MHVNWSDNEQVKLPETEWKTLPVAGSACLVQTLQFKVLDFQPDIRKNGVP